MSVASFAAVQILRALPRTRVSRAVGRLCETTLPAGVSRAVVSLYVRAYRVDLDECESPEGAYPSFDKFFTRQLKPGQRAICPNSGEIASPADGRIEAIGPIDLEGTLLVKGRPYRVAELIGDEADAQRYAGGQFAVVYLSPRDYHRVHAPVAGAITLVRSMPGDLFPVNAIGERHVPSLFSTNRRVAIVIDTDGGSGGESAQNQGMGRVTVTMVGAIIVGRITVTALPGPDVPLGDHVLDPPRKVAKGDEIGIFHLGSTAIVFSERGRAAPFGRSVGPVRLGQSLAGDA
jgi:phosphatidylserine decarboxylase